MPGALPIWDREAPAGEVLRFRSLRLLAMVGSVPSKDRNDFLALLKLVDFEALGLKPNLEEAASLSELRLDFSRTLDLRWAPLPISSDSFSSTKSSSSRSLSVSTARASMSSTPAASASSSSFVSASGNDRPGFDRNAYSRGFARQRNRCRQRTRRTGRRPRAATGRICRHSRRSWRTGPA